MKTIKLTQGKETIVDDDIFQFINQWNWYYQVDRKGIDGYAIRRATSIELSEKPNTVVRMHNVICCPPEGFEVDHINGNKLDNRKINLRIVNRSQNSQNKPVGRKNTTGYKGVSFRKDCGKYRVNIVVNYKTFPLGNYFTAKEGARAYNAAALKYYGPNAWLNDIQTEQSIDSK